MAEDLARFQDPRASRFFIRVAAAADRRGGLEHRRRLVAGLSGRVVEVGAGHGPNFALYPPQVTEVVAVEPDATMRAAAASAAASAKVPVTVVAGHGDSLPLGDGEADAVVFSLVLCMVPEPARTLAEAARVLRRGGEVRFYEHVRSPGRIRGLLQDAVTPLVAWRVGCHPNRDTVAAVQAAGLGIDQLSVFGFGPPPVKLRHVIGTAAKALPVLSASAGRWPCPQRAHPQNGYRAGMRRVDIRLRQEIGIASLTSIEKKAGLDSLMSWAELLSIPMAIASSTQRELVLDRLARSRVDPGRFKVIVCGNDVAEVKPAPDIYLLAARRLRVKPRACLVLEDLG